MRYNRRQFIATGAAAGVSAVCAPALVGKGASGDVRVAVIGMGGRGNVLADAVKKAKNARLVALCDPDSARLGKAKERFGVADGYADMRKIFDDRNIDAVVVATCNHWHCLAAITAMASGKHAYVEKPLCLSFWEGQQIVNAAEKYNRCCQIGTQMRTDPVFHPTIKKFLHEDRELGKILSVRVNRFAVRRSIGLRETPLPIPADVDYDLWLGPAQDLPIYRNQLQYDWHWMWNTGNGETGNWGAHLLDDCRNDVLENKVLIPKRVMAGGGRVGYKDAGDSPNTMFTYFDTGKFPVVFAISGLESKKKRHYTGNPDGPDSGYTVFCEGGRYERWWEHARAVDRDGKVIRSFKPDNGISQGAYFHIQNYIDAIHADDQSILSAQIKIGYDSSFWYNSANIAYRLGRPYSKADALAVPETGPLADAIGHIEEHLGNEGIAMTGENFKLSPMLRLDPETRRFTGDNADAANAIANMRPKRGKYEVPEV